MTRPLVLVASCWLVTACGGGDPADTSSAFTVRDSAGITIADNPVAPADIPVWDLPPEPRLRLGTVEGPLDQQFFRVSAATLLEDGDLVVLASGSSEVRVFGPDGTHRTSFGSAGEGPEEFGRLWHVWATDGDTLLIYDWRNQRLARWTVEGAFIDVRPLRPPFPNAPFPAGRFADGSILFGATSFDMPEQGFQWQPLVLHRFEPTGAVRDTVAEVPGQLLGRLALGASRIVFVGSPHFAPAGSAVALDDRIVVASGDAYELRVLDVAGDLSGLIRWRGRDRTVTDEDVAAFRERQLASTETDEQRRQALTYFESTPAAEEFGTTLNLMDAADGGVWALEPARPRDPEGARWIGFDGDGRLIGWLRLPPRVTLREVGSDHLIVVELDELDVEYVAVYALPWRPTSG